MANKKTHTKTQNKTQNYIIVDFLDLDTSKITLSKPKLNKYGYDEGGVDKLLYVRYDCRISPFGLSNNIFKDNEKLIGYYTSINLKKK